MKDHNGKEIFKLGFGLMRLPKLSDGSIDIEQTKVMADMFLEAGGTYFDTAYVYDNGGSEEAFRKAVVERHPRDSFTICTEAPSPIRRAATAVFRTTVTIEAIWLIYPF